MILDLKGKKVVVTGGKPPMEHAIAEAAGSVFCGQPNDGGDGGV